MRIALATVALSIAIATGIVSAGSASAQTCDQLWYERNSVFKGAGYCFKTPRAISAFGNAGCMYDVEGALPLSPDQRERVAYLIRMEQEYGCR